MPTRILNGYHGRMPVLMAGESLRTINAVAAATGTMEPAARKAYTQKLELLANDGTTPQRGGARRLTTPEEVAATLGGMGIEVTIDRRGGGAA